PQSYNVTLRNASGGLIRVINDSLTFAHDCNNGEVVVPFDTSVVSDGNYIVNVTACDNTSLCSSDISNSPYFIIDNTAPNISLNNPADSATFTSSAVTFNCSATDNFGLRCSHLYITTNLSLTNWSAGELNSSTCLSGLNDSASWTLNFENGEYLWTCRVFDLAGNDVFGSNRKFTVTAPPSHHTSGGGGGGAARNAYAIAAEFDLDILKKTRISLKSIDVVKFNVNNEEHSLQLLKILLADDSVVIKVSSVPKEYVLSLMQPKKIDVDGDGINDLSLELVDLDFAKATISIEKLFHPSSQNVFNQSKLPESEKNNEIKKQFGSTNSNRAEINNRVPFPDMSVKKRKGSHDFARILIILSVFTVIWLVYQGIKKNK
ncbi:hypothetical protein DRJ25_02075, partial [Candidatus Woesearchaeota archaeon]